MMKYLTPKLKHLAGALLVAGCAVLVSAKVVPSRKAAKKVVAANSELNVVYGHNINSAGQDEKLDLDVFMPSKMEKNKKYPLVVLIHGGTFIGGKKDGLDDECAMLADSGFVAVTINYRLGWKIPIGKDCNADLSDQPNAVYRAYQDSRAALRFLMHNADKYHIDKNWLFVGGNSAGAITALGVTYVDQKFCDKEMAVTVKKLGQLDNVSNNLTDTYKIRGVCGMWGCVPDSTLINEKTAVPAIMFHGTADKVVAYDHGRWRGVDCPNFPIEYGSANMFRQLKTYHQPAVLTSIIGAGHGPADFKRSPRKLR